MMIGSRFERYNVGVNSPKRVLSTGYIGNVMKNPIYRKF